LPFEDLEFLDTIKSEIIAWSFPEKQKKVKKLVNLLVQRQNQAFTLPKNRAESHYKEGDLVAYFPNDIYDRDMR
jgi:hypothetical protein